MIMKKAIVYFSRNGSTRLAAEILAEKLNATLIELQEKKRSGFFVSAYRALKKRSVPLEGTPEKDILPYDQIILGTPIWAGNGTPPINTFLDKADLSGKEMIIYTVQADPSLKGSEEIHEFLKDRVLKKGAREGIKCVALYGEKPGKTAQRSSLEEQLDRLKLT
jgi:flavodoxin